jgi:hypothetical protein
MVLLRNIRLLNLDQLVLTQKEAVQGQKVQQGKAHYLEVRSIFPVRTSNMSI